MRRSTEKTALLFAGNEIISYFCTKIENKYLTYTHEQKNINLSVKPHDGMHRTVRPGG